MTCKTRDNYLQLLCLFLALWGVGYVAAELGDEHCCRKRIECYECDSRFDPRCGDTFNLTRDTGTIIFCNDLCVKLKHKHLNQYFYIRTCADTFKKIQIKKTEVCYTTRSKEIGYLCFCDEDLCNAARSYFKVDRKIFHDILELAIFLVIISFLTK